MFLTSAGRYELNLYWLQNQQEKYDRTFSILANQQKLLSFGDDPLASASLVGINQTISRQGQYAASRDALKAQLNLQDQILGGVTDLMRSVRDLAVRGKNETLSPEDRKDLGQQLQEYVKQIQDQLKTQDTDNHHLFGGTNGDDPFKDPNATVQSFRVNDGAYTLTGASNLNDIMPSNQDILGYLGKVADQLKQGNVVPEDALSHIDKAMAQIDNVRSAGGAKLNQIEQLNAQADDRNLQLITQQQNLAGTDTGTIAAAASQLDIDKEGVQIIMQLIAQQNQQPSIFDMLK